MSRLRSEMALRVLLATVGIAGVTYGVLRILEQSEDTHPAQLGVWLLGALLVHDAIIAPVVIGVGAVLARFVPSRARAYLQAGLIAAGLVSVPGVILIEREGKTASPALALLEQNYLLNLLVLLALIAGVSAGSYAISVARSNRRNSRPSADH